MISLQVSVRGNRASHSVPNGMWMHPTLSKGILGLIFSFGRNSKRPLLPIFGEDEDGAEDEDKDEDEDEDEAEDEPLLPFTEDRSGDNSLNRKSKYPYILLRVGVKRCRSKRRK